MFNLLPQEQKKKIRQLYLRRFAIVSLIASICSALVLCIALIPAYVASVQKLKASQERKQIIESNLSSTDKNALKAQLTEVKSDIDTLEKKDISAMKLIEKVIINKGPGVSIMSFDLSTLATGEERLFIEGVAQNRERLKQFLANMEAQKFKKVDLPISSFAKDKDISFEMTITVPNE